jgi:hypothetical protein
MAWVFLKKRALGAIDVPIFRGGREEKGVTRPVKQPYLRAHDQKISRRLSFSLYLTIAISLEGYLL